MSRLAPILCGNKRKRLPFHGFLSNLFIILFKFGELISFRDDVEGHPIRMQERRVALCRIVLECDLLGKLGPIKIIQYVIINNIIRGRLVAISRYKSYTV